MADFVSGKHAFARVYINKQPWIIKIKSTKIVEVAVEVVDDVNGENRGRLQKITEYYNVTHTCYDDGSSSIVDNFIMNQQNEDANLPQLALSGGIVFKYLGNPNAGFTTRGCSLGPLDIDVSGRKDRVMHQVKYRCQYWEKVPAL